METGTKVNQSMINQMKLSFRPTEITNLLKKKLFNFPSCLRGFRRNDFSYNGQLVHSDKQELYEFIVNPFFS